ncbi:hypothetical protein FOLKNPGA_01275 [Legionella sp. PC1000]|nr:hypothetical protein FOLKNPGA_01275 [Legionella sp. PC1000]
MIKAFPNEFRFCFKPMNKSQHELIMEWIHQPHINEWLHGDGLNNTIKDIDQFLNDGKPWATHWIAYDNEIPFAYLITSEIGKSEEYLFGAVTLDLFISRIDLISVLIHKVSPEMVSVQTERLRFFHYQTQSVLLYQVVIQDAQPCHDCIKYKYFYLKISG